MTTPIYDQTVKATNIDPSVFPLVREQPFRLFGHKKRKRLARNASDVLRAAGFKNQGDQA